MIDMNKAMCEFKEYVSHYDMNIPSIRLKVVHTYEVVKCTKMLCEKLNLSQEQTSLACLIGLLHDIGRFEQWVKYQSFADYKTIDHALFSSELLFEKGYIRHFIEDTQYDEIIRHAIEQHNKYKIDNGFDDETLLYIHLIRDSDKLDNFRVKEEEKIEDLLYASLEDVNQEYISKDVYDQFSHQQLIYGPTRQTKIDMWLSYIAFIFDLHFQVSKDYIREKNYVGRSFKRLQPINKEVNKQYHQLEDIALDFIERGALCKEKQKN